GPFAFVRPWAGSPPIRGGYRTIRPRRDQRHLARVATRVVLRSPGVFTRPEARRDPVEGPATRVAATASDGLDFPESGFNESPSSDTVPRGPILARDNPPGRSPPGEDAGPGSTEQSKWGRGAWHRPRNKGARRRPVGDGSRRTGAADRG